MTSNQTSAAGAQSKFATADSSSYLSTSSLGAELTPDELNTLAGSVELRRFAKGEVLISEGAADDHLYAIVQGIFSASRGGRRGQERLGMLEPGMLTGELAFIDGLKRTATVTAESDECCVLGLRRAKLESLLSSHPALVYKVMRAVVRSAHRTVSMMDGVYTDLMNFIST